MDPHADAHRAVREHPLRLARGSYGVIGPRECDEEGISLCVDFDAIMRPERLAKVTPVLGQKGGVARWRSPE
jgi:hypothetical protein